jgi:hypothetical protein
VDADQPTQLGGIVLLDIRRQRPPALVRVNESEIIRGTFAAASLKLGLAAIRALLHQAGAD